MSQYAPVAPLGVLRQLDEMGALGGYQLLIAPIVLERKSEYRSFFLHRDDQLIILDNGVIELGYPLDVLRLVQAAQTVGANIVVMPDTIDDARMTVKQVRHGLEAFRKFDKYTDTLGVVQGVTFEECMKCATELADLGVDFLGVPRGLTPNLGSRVPLVKALAKETGLGMHILGFSENIEDDILAVAASPLVMGIDAATPVWLGMKGLHIGPRMPRVANFGRRPEMFWQTELLGRTDLADDVRVNVTRVRGWVQNAVQNARIERAAQLDPTAR